MAYWRTGARIKRVALKPELAQVRELLFTSNLLEKGQIYGSFSFGVCILLV